MSTIKIRPTKETPAILFDPQKGLFKMFGRSLPENSLKFWSPILHEIKKGVNTKYLDIKIKMEYYNTSSSRCVYDLLKVFKSLEDQGVKLQIQWYYEEYDEDMFEAGMDYKENLDLPIKLIIDRSRTLSQTA